MPAELERLRGFLHETSGLADPTELPWRIVAGVRRLLPCDAVGYNEVDLRAPRMAFLMDPVDAAPPGMAERFAALAHEHPLIAHHQRTGDGSARQFSDFVTRPQLHRLAIYQDVYRHLGAEHQIAIVLPDTGGTIVGIAMNRRRRGFSERERALLNVARDHLALVWANARRHARVRCALAAADGASDGVILLDRGGGIEVATPRAQALLAAYVAGPVLPVLRAWRDAVRAGGPPALVRRRDGGRLVVRLVAERTLLLEEQRPQHVLLARLTPRQREVLDHVADGCTDAEIALRLGLSARTVQKHLEHAYVRLGVENRTAAATLVLRAARPGPR